MPSPNLTQLQERFDAVVTRLLPQLRLTKVVDEQSLAALSSVLDGLREVLGQEPMVPRKLTGELWFVFAAMLTEADHTSDEEKKEAILTAAWNIQEQLLSIFGPKF